MSWLAEDSDMLDFALEMIERWEDIESIPPIDSNGGIQSDEGESAEVCMSESDSPATPPAATETATIDKPKEKKNRGRRREEILLLREKVKSLEQRLTRLKIHHHQGSQLMTTGLRWEEAAKRQLAGRRRSEQQNARLRASLVSHVKTAQRLTHIIARSSRLAVSALQNTHPDPALDLRTRVEAMVPLVDSAFEGFGSHIAEDKSFDIRIHDQAGSHITEIEMMATWRLVNTNAPVVETALWQCFTNCASRVGSVSYIREVQILRLTSTTMESTVIISPAEGHEFKGDEKRQCTRDSSSRFVVVSSSRVLPDDHMSGVFSGATLLEEESWLRVSALDPSTVMLQARVDLKLHAGSAGKSQRLLLADAVVVHSKEELHWLQQYVARPMGNDLIVPFEHPPLSPAMQATDSLPQEFSIADSFPIIT